MYKERALSLGTALRAVCAVNRVSGTNERREGQRIQFGIVRLFLTNMALTKAYAADVRHFAPSLHPGISCPRSQIP